MSNPPRSTDRSRNSVQLTRRQWLAAAGVGIAGLTGVDARFVEPNRLTVSVHSVGKPNMTSRPFRLVQLSDLHLRGTTKRAARVAATVAALHPDHIVITGDAIDDAKNLGLLESFLDMLEAPVPKTAILGNCEHWAGINAAALGRAYSRRDCNLLVNEPSELSIGQRRLTLLGIDDFVGGHPNLETTMQRATSASNSILLQHCPAFRDTATAIASSPRDGLRLMLSGHTHAGQFAPFGWAPLRPYGSGRYVQGWYRDENRWPLYVSRGIGTSIAPVRLFAPPEIAVFDLSLE